MDFIRGPEMAKFSLEQRLQEAEEQRLIKELRAAKKAQKAQPQMIETVGRQMIRLGWRLAGTKSGTLVVNEGRAGRELWVVDVPC